MNIRYWKAKRAGNTIVLTAFMMIALAGMLAFAVDLGYVLLVRTEMQRTADAAAIASAWELIDPGALRGQANSATTLYHAAAKAREFSQLNHVAGQTAALAASDITFGYLANPSDPNAAMSFADPSRYNAAKIRVRRTLEQNGRIPLFFGGILGTDNASVELDATAAFVNNFAGFKKPSDDTNLGILPLALDKETWDSLLQGHGADAWTWDVATGQLHSGGDGVLEINLYPQGTGAPGNRGTVRIGHDNNSTAIISRQITNGLSQQDLDNCGGELKLNANGQLILPGDPGLSAAIKDDLEAIKGQPRIIPIYSQVTSQGANALYTIVEFGGIRITDVKLTGSMSSKRVTIQPASILSQGAIPSTGGTSSHFIYSPVWLVR
jgi:hypothetical protein